MRKQSIVQFMEEYASEYVGTEREKDIRPIVLELMSDGVKEKDAYHMATAIFAGCDYFISTDYRLLKHKSEKIRVVNPIEFILETEGTNDD